MAESSRINNRPSHRIIFLYFVAFITAAGLAMALLSEYFNNRDVSGITVKEETAGKLKPQVTVKPTVAEQSIDISKQPLLHVRQQQLAVYFNQAVVMLHAKRYELAAVALHKVLEIDPKMPEAHINMGFSLLGLERPKAARDFFLTALELDDSQLNAFYGLALSHAALLEYQSAIGAIVSYIHLSPAQEPYVKSAHEKLQAWRKVVSEQQKTAESSKS